MTFSKKYFDVLKTVPQYLIPKELLTVLLGCLADVKKTRLKNRVIRWFIETYRVDMSEALQEDLEAYVNFNEFFIRQLKPELRPLSAAPIISPVDGSVSEIGKIEQGQLLQAKKRHYSVAQLLACTQESAKVYQNGHFCTLYLSPKDYHRVHMPIDGQLLSMTYVPGALFSVQPTTARVIPNLFARNERLIVYFQTSAGPMAMVFVGATIVGAIATRWHGELKRAKKQQHFDYSHEAHWIKKGEEVGFFKLGSTVILLFAHDAIQWNPELKAGASIRFGQALGTCNET